MNIRSFHTQLVVLHIAMLAVMVTFAGLAPVLWEMFFAGSRFEFFSRYRVFVTLAALLPLAAGKYLFSYLTDSITAREKIEERQNRFRAAFLIRLALTEASVLVLLTGYLISGLWIYFLFSLGGIVYFGYLFPSKDSLTDNLSYKE